MTNDLLTMNIPQIQVEPGLIQFEAYESIKQQALELAANIENVEVTDENIKVSKKLLATVNKRVKEMEDHRIAIKKEILQPYNHFENQIKEIVSIVKDADNIVRDQIRELEEKERDEKRSLVEALFEKRIKHYSFGDVFTFEKFIKPVHLNKSVSMKIIEHEMVGWLEKIDEDLKAINSLPNSDAILTEYYDTKDVGVAIRIVNEREQLKQKMKQTVEPVKKAVSNAYNITLSSDTDLMVVEMFMQLKNIKYTIEKVEI